MATKVASAQIVNSTLDNSPIGSSAPSTGILTELTVTDVLNTQGLEIAGFGTAPTLGPSDDSTSIATTAFVRSLFPATASSIEFPNGLIIQWGFAPNTAPDSTFAFTFDTPFPNNIFVLLCSPQASGTADNIAWSIISKSVSGGELNTDGNNTGFYYIAIGN